MTENTKPAFSRNRAVIILGVIILLVIGAIALWSKGLGGMMTGSGTPAPIAVTQPAENTNMKDKYRITVELSGGQSAPPTEAALPPAQGAPLSAEEAATLLARLPALPTDASLQTGFNRPAESLPPPQPGNKIQESFPPSAAGSTPPEVLTAPLQVTRFAPEGEIPIAPFVSVTFNQPMVPVGTLGDLAEKDVPVKIDPTLTGTWRWLGTKTLTFEYDSKLIDRLPKATEYRVTVPAGVKSASGNALAESVTWTFTTPPPKIISSYPDAATPQPLNPIVFILFDQRIDPAAVLKTIRMQAANQDVNIVLASQAEVDKDARVSQMVKDAQAGRWLAFRSVEPLPAGTNITVTVGPETPSAEGPRVTKEAQAFNFSTYSQLKIVEYRCSWGDNQCPPLTPFYIRFNNPLDMDVFSEDMLSVAPEIPGISANVFIDTINISGETKGQTTYTVAVSGKIQDVFGQKLGKDQTLKFKVGKAEPTLVNSGQNFLTLDPSAKSPVFSFYAINYSKVNLKVYSVKPTDWSAYKKYLQEWQQTDKPAKMPGILLEDKSLALNIPADTLSQVDVKLSQYLNGDLGHVVLIIQPPAGMFETDDQKWQRFSQTIIAWVQSTQIGLDAYNDQSDLVAWATDLKNGAPLSGVSIAPNVGGKEFITDANGVARFEVPNGATYLTAQNGADTALLPCSNYFLGDYSWLKNPPRDSMRWFVFDDRAMYKPGEEVHLKGWLRKIGGGQQGDVGPVNGINAVGYQIIDPQGNSIGEGQAQVNALGGFDFVFTIPQGANLGYATVSLNVQGSSLDGTQFAHQFQIQEFRRPEFEVNARNETPGPYFAGDSATLAVEAKYYAGGGLPNADVTWNIATSPASYSPPNWSDFTFGSWRPWWFMYAFGPFPPNGGDVQTVTFTGKTDAAGAHYLKLDFKAQGDPNQDPQPYSAVANATVMDVNRQAWNSTTTLLIHPADLYIGLRSAAYFVEKGTPLKVDFIVTDLDGKPVENRAVVITAGRVEWKYKKGAWQEEIVDVQTCKMTSKSQPDTCKFETPIGGTYKITAVVTDEKGRKNQTQFTRWVSGGQMPPSRKVEQEKVTLIPDKESYQPGDTAKILVQAPFAPAEGFLTVTRSGILYTKRFTIQDGTATLEIPIEDAHIPNLNIQVDLVGSAPRTDDQGEKMANVPPRPAFASGRLDIKIPPTQRTLALEVKPTQTGLEPGGQTTLNLAVKDARGFPVANSELAVVVVDEAILALTNYKMQNPLELFYQGRPSNLSSVYGRANIILANPQILARTASERQLPKSDSYMAAGMALPPAAAPMPTMTAAFSKTDEGGDAQTPIMVRTNFNPLAVFSPSVKTDFNGEAQVQIKLPDNLTRYRIMVVAVDDSGKQFGTGESNLTARLPLMVRPSAPRFLNFGDKFELPVVLQNQTDAAMAVDVVIRAANLELGVSGQRVNVPANDRVEVRFPASTIRAGKVHIQIAATSGSYADAATVDLPVYTPSTTEAFATYGVVDNGTIAQPVQYPTNVFPQYGGLQVSTSSTALQALTDAVLYLVQYPFECSEQLASRILTVSSLRDVLTAFKADGLPSPAEMESTVKDDITRLQSLQNDDGGFPYWRHGFESIPFNTIHVTHALLRAQEKGFTVPSDMMQRSLAYLRDIESHYPSYYSQDTKWTLSAYALYVRNLAGDRDSAKASKLLNDAGMDHLSMEAVGWLWSVIDDPQQLDAIRTYVNNHVVETAGAANFTTAYTDQTYLLLSSDRRTDAILLDALIEDNPKSDLISKVVNGLLAHRTKGRWNNTEENVFVLIALDRYFNTYESQTPDFVARLWLGNTYAGQNEFHGYTADIHETLVPMSDVLNETALNGTSDLILSKEGAGRLYYRIGLNYAPTNLHLDPLDMGFVVERSYEGVDNPADVTRDSNGVWHIKAGARVKVKIKMVADNRRYHVALVDPLPAGLEIINPALAVSQPIPQDTTSPDFKYGWWWWGPWYEHQNMRDDRAEAFTSLLWDGVYDYSYFARATTPGTYIVPPTKAEEMYSPEVFGRSASDWVVVE